MNKKNILTIFILFILISFTPAVSHARNWNGWIYQDPYPTSNSLFAVKFITPNKGWVAGEVGTILFTENGGDTWEAQESGTEQTLTSIFFVNDKIGWAVGERGIIIHTYDGGRSWTTQIQTDLYLLKVLFVNEQEGWAAGRQGILHTADGGKKWARLEAEITGTIASLFFINPKTGWVLAGGTVYSTRDGGEKWDKSTLPRIDYPVFRAPPELVPNMLGDRGDIYFTDDRNGWAVVGFSLIFHSNDGGKTWVNQLHTGPDSYGVNRLSFINEKKGCATGSSILCTEDGGIVWNEKLGVAAGSWKGVDDFWFAIELYGVSFTGQSIGWAVGEKGQIWKTVQGGKKWSLSSRRDECGDKTFFVDKKTGWLFGNENTFICRTDDGGVTRQKQETGILVANLYFIDKLNGWAVGCLKEEKSGAQEPGYHPGKVWNVIRYTNNGGKTWTTQLKDLVSNDLFYHGLLDVYFTNPKIGWAVGYKGSILHTRDGGRNWEYQKKADDPELNMNGIWFVNSQQGWVIGTRITEVWTGFILHTQDAGKHWQKQYELKEVENAALSTIFFIDDKSGWATGETASTPDYVGDGLLLHTVNSGNTWSVKKFDGIGNNHVAFIDKNRGVITTEKGWIIITTDAGKTWRKMRIPIKKYPWHFSDLLEAEFPGK